MSATSPLFLDLDEVTAACSTSWFGISMVGMVVIELFVLLFRIVMGCSWRSDRKMFMIAFGYL